MLSMLLLLAAAPQSATTATAIPSMPQEPMRPAEQGRSARMPVLGQTPAGCAPGPIAANDPTSPGNGLLWREGGEAVGLYRLLDRYVHGCPAPIIVNYRVPGSNAVGREAGRAPAPSPVIVRRP